MDAGGDVLPCVHSLSLAVECRLNQVPLMFFPPPARRHGHAARHGAEAAGRAEARLLEERRIWFVCYCPPARLRPAARRRVRRASHTAPLNRLQPALAVAAGLVQLLTASQGLPGGPSPSRTAS